MEWRRPIIILCLLICYFSYAIPLCPINYRSCDKLCILESSNDKTFCEASRSCKDIKGRLALWTEMEIIKECVNNATIIFTSVTDLLNERYRNRTEWMNVDGSLTTNTKLWNNNEPDNPPHGEDCTALSKGVIFDYPCVNKARFVCVSENMNNVNSKVFAKNVMNIFNNDNDQGCHEKVTAKSKLLCAIS